MSSDKIDILKRALKREKASRQIAEKILEEKSLQIYNSSKVLNDLNLKLEKLLQSKTDQFDSFYQNIFDAYLKMDLDGNVLKMNTIATELFGYNLDKEKLNVFQLIDKEDYPYAIDSFKTLLKEGVFADFRSKIITKNSELRWVHINSSIILGDTNEVIGVHGIVRDITETITATALIQSQNEQLDIIVDNTSFGIALVKNENFIRTNNKLKELLGFSNEGMRELNFMKILFGDDYKRYEKQIHRMYEGEIDNFILEYRYKRKDRVVSWHKINFSSVKDANGQINYILVLLEDITFFREKRLITEMMNDVAKNILGKNDLYDIAYEITNNISDFLGTKDCVIYLVNEKANNLEQIASAHKENRVPQETNTFQLQMGEGIVGSIAKSGIAEIVGDTSIDPRYVKQDEIMDSEITVPIISDGIVIAVIDSEHKDCNYFSKDQLKTLKDIANLVSLQLKNAIYQRERIKIEEQNMELLYKLEKSNNELEEYAHVVSHDLKSPLRNINALMSWIKEDNQENLNDITVQNFKYIDLTLEKMEELISDILDYSKINSDSDRSEEIDINEIVKNLKKIILIPEHITIRVLSKLPIVRGNYIKLQQVFQNLISNAIKFSNKDKGIIEIDANETKTHFHFSVKDNGIGIEEKYHKEIFKIYKTYTNNQESSGIGLSIVRKIIEIYDGNIYIVSKVGKGSTFHFSIKK